MSAHNAKMSRRGPPPHSGVATARRPVFNFNSGSAPSPDRCLNQGKSSLIKVNQGKSRWKKWVGPASRGQPANRASDGHRWNGERCCGWLKLARNAGPVYGKRLIPNSRIRMGAAPSFFTACPKKQQPCVRIHLSQSTCNAWPRLSPGSFSLRFAPATFPTGFAVPSPTVLANNCETCPGPAGRQLHDLNNDRAHGLNHFLQHRDDFKRWLIAPVTLSTAANSFFVPVPPTTFNIDMRASHKSSSFRTPCCRSTAADPLSHAA